MIDCEYDKFIIKRIGYMTFSVKIPLESWFDEFAWPSFNFR